MTTQREHDMSVAEASERIERLEAQLREAKYRLGDARNLTIKRALEVREIESEIRALRKYAITEIVRLNKLSPPPEREAK